MSTEIQTEIRADPEQPAAVARAGSTPDAALAAAGRLLTEVVAYGAELRLDPRVPPNDPRVLTCRARAVPLTPELRAELAAHWADVVALLARYDDFLPYVGTWPKAVMALLDWLEIPPGRRITRRFMEEAHRMRLVWEVQPWPKEPPCETEQHAA